MAMKDYMSGLQCRLLRWCRLKRVQKEDLVHGRWYWVRTSRYGWFPAKHHLNAAGGWTNEDTWEDFDCEVIDWQIIPLPR